MEGREGGKGEWRLGEMGRRGGGAGGVKAEWWEEACREGKGEGRRGEIESEGRE